MLSQRCQFQLERCSHVTEGDMKNSMFRMMAIPNIFFGMGSSQTWSKEKTERKPTGPLSQPPDDPGSVGGWLMIGQGPPHLQSMPTLPKSGHHRHRHPLVLHKNLIFKPQDRKCECKHRKEGSKVKSPLSQVFNRTTSSSLYWSHVHHFHHGHWSLVSISGVSSIQSRASESNRPSTQQSHQQM